MKTATLVCVDVTENLMSHDYFLACHKCQKRKFFGVMKAHGWYLEEPKDVLKFVMDHYHEDGGPQVVDDGSSEFLDYERED